MTGKQAAVLVFVLLLFAVPACADPIVVGTANLTFHANPGMYGGYSNIVSITNLTSNGLNIQGFAAMYASVLGWPAASIRTLP